MPKKAPQTIVATADLKQAKELRALAADIARELFTDRDGRLAVRLQQRHLWRKGELAGSGWNEESLATHIAEILLARQINSQSSSVEFAPFFAEIDRDTAKAALRKVRPASDPLFFAPPDEWLLRMRDGWEPGTEKLMHACIDKMRTLYRGRHAKWPAKEASEYAALERRLMRMFWKERERSRRSPTLEG